MLLRSSSTPLLGSLLSSISENPSNNYNPPAIPHSKLSFQISPGSLHRTNVSCTSSPASGISNHNSFRRAQSDGNLQGLVINSSNQEPCTSDQHRRLSARNKCSMLETIPSFSLHNSRARYDEEDDESDIEEAEEERAEFQEEGGLVSESLARERETCKKKKMTLNGRHTVNTILLSEEVRRMTKIAHFDEGRGLQLAGQEMSFAMGLGIDSAICGGGCGGDQGGNGHGLGGYFNHADGGNGGESNRVEEYYKKMVEENPGNALFLRNYAQFLYESKRVLPRAEEYYSRAILVDPKDGEILSQYAKLVWELHRDEARALIYHERAVQAAPQDSHVHAAYASFLWETEEDDNECNTPTVPQLQEAMASA